VIQWRALAWAVVDTRKVLFDDLLEKNTAEWQTKSADNIKQTSLEWHSVSGVRPNGLMNVNDMMCYKQIVEKDVGQPPFSLLGWAQPKA